jgi:hypothetical protein
MRTDVGKSFILFSGLLTYLCCSPCAADTFTCPSELRVAQEIGENVKDWKPFNSKDRHPYIGVSFSQGPPDEQVILAPSSEKKHRGNIIATWELPPSTDGYWVSCLYSKTSAVVVRKLEGNPSSCEVEYDNRFSTPVAKQWRCNSRVK